MEDNAYTREHSFSLSPSSMIARGTTKTTLLQGTAKVSEVHFEAHLTKGKFQILSPDDLTSDRASKKTPESINSSLSNSLYYQLCTYSVQSK